MQWWPPRTLNARLKWSSRTNLLKTHAAKREEKTEGGSNNNCQIVSNKIEKHVAQGYYNRKPVTYCHTHSITTNLKHNSYTCLQRGKKHNETATLHDKKGGNPNIFSTRKWVKYSANGAQQVQTIANTGASDHFFEFSHTNLPVVSVCPTNNGISVLITTVIACCQHTQPN